MRIKHFPISDTKFSPELLEQAKQTYDRYHHSNDPAKNDHVWLHEQMEELFFKPFHSLIIRLTEYNDKVRDVFVKELYKGKVKTLLEKISYALFSRYIKGKPHSTKVGLSEKHFKKLPGISPHDFIRIIKKDISALLKNIMNITIWRENCHILIECNLR